MVLHSGIRPFPMTNFMNIARNFYSRVFFSKNIKFILNKIVIIICEVNGENCLFVEVPLAKYRMPSLKQSETDLSRNRNILVSYFQLRSYKLQVRNLGSI